jgi:hypothetical protein
VTFIKIRSHRRKFSNSDSAEQKIKLNGLLIISVNIQQKKQGHILSKQEMYNESVKPF